MLNILFWLDLSGHQDWPVNAVIQAQSPGQMASPACRLDGQVEPLRRAIQAPRECQHDPSDLAAGLYPHPFFPPSRSGAPTLLYHDLTRLIDRPRMQGGWQRSWIVSIQIEYPPVIAA
jgi:hypothetical protein